MRTKKLIATSIAGLIILGGSITACSDEDGDGAVTDEEVDSAEEKGQDAKDEVEEEIDEGEDEINDDSGN
jgi:hypothetical protein